MKKLITLTLLAITLSLASYALTPITGATGTCVGSYGTVSDTTTGGIWSSSNPAVATVGSTTGYVLGVSAGVTTITYTLGTSSVTETFTVSPAPAAITGGPLSGCVGGTATLTDATPGGIWSSSNPAIASIGSATGLLTAVSGGFAYIYYTVGSGCRATTMDTVIATVAGSIAGPTTVCAGGTITLTDSGGTGGTWSSSSTAIATVGATTGVVTGVSGGTVTITLTTTSTCGSAYTTRTITVSTTTTPGTISGPGTVMVGSTITLTDGVGGGTWTSSTPGIATIGASTGVVTGVSVGTDVIDYTVTGCSGPVTIGTTVTVNPFDGISGHVLFGSGAYSGLVKVWLITYDTATHILAAMDSVSLSSSGTSVYYQFTGIPTDSFRVKAAVNDTSSTLGYIPTYHTASFYWHGANVINHTSGTADINQDINMAYGTVTPGPGFIGGNVMTGANRGTSGGVPAVGLLISVMDASGTLLGHTYTDASGNYSFSNLPVGATYTIYPEALNYTTTAYTSISLTAAAPSMTVASFTQHTFSKTITPHTSGVLPVAPSVTSVIAFPNPTNGKLNIQWNENTTEQGQVTIADITGRELFNATINMNQSTGMKQIDLSNLANGLYIINVKSGSINYNNKIQIQH